MVWSAAAVTTNVAYKEACHCTVRPYPYGMSLRMLAPVPIPVPVIPAAVCQHVSPAYKERRPLNDKTIPLWYVLKTRVPAPEIVSEIVLATVY